MKFLASPPRQIDTTSVVRRRFIIGEFTCVYLQTFLIFLAVITNFEDLNHVGTYFIVDRTYEMH